MGFAKPTLPNNEAERLLALRGFKVLDTDPEIAIDDITLLASQICGTPIALVSLLDENRQWFKSKIGIEVSETPRELAFCAHAIHESKTFIVEDATKDPRFSEHPLVADSGGLRLQFYAGAQLKTSSGFNIGTLCVIDHTPRKLAAAQIQALDALARQVIVNFENRHFKREAARREVFLSSIVGLIPDLVSYIDSDLTYRYVNVAYEKWFKKKISDIMGKKVAKLFGDEAFRLANPFMKQALLGNQQDFQLSLPYMVQGKPLERTVRAHYLPDFNEEKEVIGFYSVVSDISDLKALETKALEKGSALKEALEKSRASEKSFRTAQANLFASAKMASLGQMAGGVAHEINNPLAIIQGRTELLLHQVSEGRLDSAKISAGLELIHRTAQRIAKIIIGLRAFCRSSDFDPVETVEIKKIVEETVALCGEKFKEHDVELRIKVPGSLTLECRPTEISQILMNLLNNSYDAILPLAKKWIALQVSGTEDSVKISVIDCGEGIDENTRSRVMEPFFTTKPVGQGTGLGLSISKGLVESHKGTLEYNPSAKNTCFELKIPRKQVNAARKAAA